MADWQEIPASCPDARPVVLVNRKSRRYFHVGCNRWRCSACGRRKAKTVQQRMLLMRPTHLLTISLRREATLADLPELHKKKRAFFRWMARQPWGLVQHGWAPELGQKTGQLHLHCLVRMRRGWLPYRQIQGAAARIGLGVPDFQRIWRPAQAVAYAAKYITKNLVLTAKHLTRRVRRFGLSTGLTLPKNADWDRATRDDNLPSGDNALVLKLPPVPYFFDEPLWPKAPYFPWGRMYAVPSG